MSYSPNYFSLDDILVTQERTRCTLLTNVPKLGSLNSSSESPDLAVGSTIELPIWLGQNLSLGRQPVVSTELPKIFTENYREILKADATAVDLYKLNLYFYELGSYVKALDVRGDVADVLVNTFTARFRNLMDLADNAGSDPNTQGKLDTLERGLFSEGHKARAKLNSWFSQTGLQLEAATMVMNHKKRKRVDFIDN